MVDTAVSGFAVGAGFAVLENLTYIPDLSTSGLIASAVRGLGTAIMHGGTTAIFGAISASMREIRGPRSLTVFLPGFAMAIAIHELYNQPLWPPVIAGVVVLVTLPAVMAFIYWQSENALEKMAGRETQAGLSLTCVAGYDCRNRGTSVPFARLVRVAYAVIEGPRLRRKSSAICFPICICHSKFERARKRRFAAPRDWFSGGAQPGYCQGN